MQCYQCNYKIQSEFKFCPNCGSNLNSITCDNCNFINSPNSKFCQECGNNLNSKESKRKAKSILNEESNIQIPVPAYGITIEFGYSTSQSFDFAVKAAKMFDSFLVIGEDKKAIYRITVNEDETSLLDPLLEHLKGWRKRAVYVNGEKMLWDSVFMYLWSYNERKSSYKPELYCFGYGNDYDFNLWGCMRTRLPFGDNSELYTYGKWLNKDGDWQFDKERIRHTLEVNLFNFRYCPALNLKFIQEVIDAFPDIINPYKDSNWQFVENYGEDKEGLRIVTTEYGYKEEKFMKGVAPKNKRVILNLLRSKLKTQIPNNL